MSETKTKIRSATALEVCSSLKLTDPARALLTPEIKPLDFLNRLNEADLFADAVQFLAIALPKREAVWWAATCARDLPPDAKQPAFGTCLDVAEAWVRRPTEENRRAAEKAANLAKESHPARWTAMAAFWSGGSLTPKGEPEVPPSDDFTAKAVGGAVMMAVGADGALVAQRKKKFLDAGLDIAKGGFGRSAPAAG